MPIMAGVVLRAGWSVLSVDYRTLPGATLNLRLRRTDGLFYNAATESWTASITDNPLPPASGRARNYVRVSLSGSDTTYSIRLVPTGGTVRIFHVQSEIARKGHGWPSSRIVTRATAATREHSYLELSNDAGARTCPGLDGTGRLRWRPAFDAEHALNGGAFVLRRVVYGADEAELRYQPGMSFLPGGKLQHRRTVAGITYTAELPLDVLGGEDYRIAYRWQSRGQNGDAPGTISVWCEGQVARAAGPATLAETATSSVRRGSSENVDGTQAEGWIWDETFEPFVLSDGELEDW
jgi:hypothetical protein